MSTQLSPRERGKPPAETRRAAEKRSIALQHDASLMRRLGASDGEECPECGSGKLSHCNCTKKDTMCRDCGIRWGWCEVHRRWNVDAMQSGSHLDCPLCVGDAVCRGPKPQNV